MNISLLGPQGSGKGTQTHLITQKYPFVVFESGRQLRRVSQSPTALGIEIKSLLESGTLIPNQDIYFLTKDWLSDIDSSKNILFDGYPRRLSQAKDLLGLLADRGQSINLVLSLKISDKIATERLLGRLLCQNEEHVYNLVTSPSKNPGICDIDGSPLAKRDDETPETIGHRLAIFRNDTEPLIESLKKTSEVVDIDANLPVMEVFEQISQVLDKHLSKK